MDGDNHRYGEGVTTDRRALLKASGVAAGAGALGVLPGVVTADASDSHYVVASDSHLGSPFSNIAAFETFLREEVPEVNPDVLILNGDVFEMWLRGLESTLLEFTRISNYLEDLNADGTDVVLTAGNHDRRLITIGENAFPGLEPDPPWQIGNEYYFESGDTSFVAAHGDGGDPLQINPVSELICLTTDGIGATLLDIYEWYEGARPGIVGEAGAVQAETSNLGWQVVSLAQNYDDPVVVTSPAASAGSSPVAPQVRNTAGGHSQDGTDYFGLRLESWDDGTDIAPLPEETVNYAVFETGRHVLGTDTDVAVDRVTAGDAWTTVSFEESFDAAPAVVANVQTVDRTDRPFWDSNPALARVRNVTASGFEVRVAEQTGNDIEREVGYVAVEPGLTGGQSGPITTATTGDIDETWQTTSFSREFLDAPTLLAGPQTANNTTLPVPRYRNLGAASVDFTLKGENGATLGSTEEMAHIALPPTDAVYATESTLGYVNDLRPALEERWRELAEQSTVMDPSDVPDQPPGLSPDERRVSTQGTRQNLLDIYPDRFVVYGHTHAAGLGERYVNSGAWTSRGTVTENTYIEIVDGDITVWKWKPDGRDVLFQ